MEPLKKESLYRHFNLSAFDFSSTAEIAPIEAVIGQERALEAISFSTSIAKEGYNLFAMGPTGIGKHTAIMTHIKKEAKNLPTPNDYCYVNNFKDSRIPRILDLPSGRGEGFQKEITELIEDLLNIFPASFDSREYRDKKERLQEQLKVRESDVFETVREQARKDGIGFLRSTEGFGFVPIHDNGDIITSEEFEAISAQDKKVIQEKIALLQKQLQEILREIAKWKRETQKEIKHLNKSFAKEIVAHLIADIKKSYGGIDGVDDFLEALEEDITESVDEFLHPGEKGAGLFALPAPKNPMDNPSFNKYKVNVLINHTEEGAPVIHEDNPTFQNLVGHIEHIAQFVTLLTDFSLIKPGALHRANGGYLILDARKLLMQPFAWEGLKRIVRAKEIRIESLEQAMSLTRTTSLEPEPLKLDVKIILLGERQLYYLLYAYDPEFRELFKVVADFENEMPRSDENALLYAKMIATVAQKHVLLPLAPSAVGRIIEHSSRMAGDAAKLSTHIGSIADILEEADHLAKSAQKSLIDADDITGAVENRRYRNSRIKERMFESITEGTVMIDTDGAVVGQINALSVIALGEYAFGRPSRITAKTRLGSGKIIDIEREVDLGGAIHSKGVMILASFLGSRFVRDMPLSLFATLAFEQSYGGVDGDSASSTELYALLSSLSEVPIKQSFAVTGSVNQHGQIQPIGGVNEKIEGFFDLCKSRGFAKEQGVIIPRQNVRHLMLKKEVQDAVEAGDFAIYAIATVDEGIEILTGKKAGNRLKNGRFEKGSINDLVEQKLQKYAKVAMRGKEKS
jgi:predicted ATP-dependent protease